MTTPPPSAPCNQLPSSSRLPGPAEPTSPSPCAAPLPHPPAISPTPPPTPPAGGLTQTHPTTAVPPPAAAPSLDGRISTNGGTGRRKTLPSRPYPCGLWYYRSEHGEVAPYYCLRWHCPTCAPKLADRWAALILEAHPERHIVITDLGPDPARARASLRNIVKAIRRGQAHGRGGRSNTIACEYFAALETNSSGSIHAHLLQHGNSIPQRGLSEMLPAYGAGPICWTRSIATAARPLAVARYVARHLVGHHHADQVKQGRRVRYSRGFWGRPISQVTADLRSAPLDDPTTWILIKPDVQHREAEAEALSAYRKERIWQTQMRRAFREGWSDAKCIRLGLYSIP